MKAAGISASRIGTYEQCLFKYFLNYHLKEKLKSNYGAVNGSLIHSILERYATKVDTDYVDQLLKGFRGELQTIDNFDKEVVLESPLKYAKPAEYKDVKPICDACPYAKNARCEISGESLEAINGCGKKLFEDSLKMTREALNRYKDALENKFVAGELKIKFHVPGCDVPITSILDLVLLRDSTTIEVVDYKTGKWTKNYDECREDMQVRMCSVAARDYFITNGEKNGYSGIKSILVTFDYFTATPVTLAFSAEEDAATIKEIASTYNKIRNQKTVTRVIGNGKFDWRCKSMCDIEVCSKHWKGPIQLNSDDEVIS